MFSDKVTDLLMTTPTLFFPSLAIVAKVKVWQTVRCLEGRVHVEEIGNVGQVQTLVALDNILGTHKLSTADLVCLLKHFLSSFLRV